MTQEQTTPHSDGLNALIELKDLLIAGAPIYPGLGAVCVATSLNKLGGVVMQFRISDAANGCLNNANVFHNKMLPGWGYRLNICFDRDEASVFPNYQSPAHGQNLAAKVPYLIEGKEWAKYTRIKLRPAGNPAKALLVADLKAMIAMAMYQEGHIQETPKDQSLLHFGYAPGGYTIHCKDCGEMPDFASMPIADKRSWRCKGHAEQALARALSGEAPDDR